jgi:hypothetical protein
MTGLAARLDLTRPADGLLDIAVGAMPWHATRLLGVVVAPLPQDAADAPTESHVRGADLVVAYEASAHRPVRVDALWRAVAPAAGDQFLAAADLIVSVRTDLLDSRPELGVQSVLPACEIVRLTARDPIAGEALPHPENAPAAFGRENGLGCLLFRPPGHDLSYAEMVHPADFQRDELHCGAPGSREVRVVHQLFSMSLEKGVILRARVRGVFVPRRDDARIAAECYAAFAAADPPLGT